jgi:hypothetical protein
MREACRLFLLGRCWWQLLVAVFLAMMFTQTGFIGHDAHGRPAPRRYATVEVL